MTSSWPLSRPHPEHFILSAGKSGSVSGFIQMKVVWFHKCGILHSLHTNHLRLSWSPPDCGCHVTEPVDPRLPMREAASAAKVSPSTVKLSSGSTLFERETDALDFMAMARETNHERRYQLERMAVSSLHMHACDS